MRADPHATAHARTTPTLPRVMRLCPLCASGVDPAARRRMFDVILQASKGRSTITTTHVMEESEGLCTRIAIMVSGRLACLGSPQHLKVGRH